MFHVNSEPHGHTQRRLLHLHSTTCFVHGESQLKKFTLFLEIMQRQWEPSLLCMLFTVAYCSWGSYVTMQHCWYGCLWEMHCLSFQTCILTTAKNSKAAGPAFQETIQQVVTTRWNNTVCMLQSLLEQKCALCAYAADYDLLQMFNGSQYLPHLKSSHNINQSWNNLQWLLTSFHLLKC